MPEFVSGKVALAARTMHLLEGTTVHKEPACSRSSSPPAFDPRKSSPNPRLLSLLAAPLLLLLSVNIRLHLHHYSLLA
jgi:hypothetical protein